jgi:hypothetical protein
VAKIPKTFGQGGAHLTPGASGDPDLGAILRDMAVDLQTLDGGGGSGASAITAPALAAFTDPPTAAEMAALRTLVNQIRAFLVTLGGGGSGTLLTSVET